MASVLESVAVTRGLPSIPAVLGEVIVELEDAAASGGRIAACLGRDQGLVARLLRVANSPVYGLSGRVASVRDAITVLGLRNVRMLVIAATVAKAFRGPFAAPFDPQRFWRHSLAAAYAARAHARICGEEPERAFTAGLLHDLGKLVLLAGYPEDCRAIVAFHAQEGCSSLEAERHRLGFTHAEVGAVLARHWRFAECIEEAIGLHHHDRCELSGLTALVQDTDLLCHATRDGAAPQQVERAAERLPRTLDGNQLRELAEALAQGAGTAALLVN